MARLGAVGRWGPEADAPEEGSGGLVGFEAFWCLVLFCTTLQVSLPHSLPLLSLSNHLRVYATRCQEMRRVSWGAGWETAEGPAVLKGEGILLSAKHAQQIEGHLQTSLRCVHSLKV